MSGSSCCPHCSRPVDVLPDDHGPIAAGTCPWCGGLAFRCDGLGSGLTTGARVDRFIVHSERTRAAACVLVVLEIAMIVVATGAMPAALWSFYDLGRPMFVAGGIAWVLAAACLCAGVFDWPAKPTWRCARRDVDDGVAASLRLVRANVAYR